jgi:integrase
VEEARPIKLQSRIRVISAGPTGPHPSIGDLHRRFKTALTAAKLPPIKWHNATRHSFGTRLAAAGVPIRTIAEWMGHEDIDTTMIYAHYSPGAGEADVIERAFGSSVHSSVHSEDKSDQLEPTAPA